MIISIFFETKHNSIFEWYVKTGCIYFDSGIFIKETDYKNISDIENVKSWIEKTYYTKIIITVY